ncbi:MAG: NAD(P)H-binding protein [Acidimicrobiia bacterium]|nr:NAD(P)H-binding protein [Acidimicrobiia bacterium]
MKVFVLGGTGAIGRPAVDSLVAAGHDVEALARSDESAAKLRSAGAEPVSVSIFDRAGLTDAFSGHDAVVNLTTAQPSTFTFIFLRAWRNTERIRTEGSAAVVDAALAAGVPVVIQESVVMVCRDNGDQWVDETTPVDHYPMAVGNHAAEASANRFTDAGGNGIVARFGFFYGTGAQHADDFLTMARRGIVPVIGRPDSYLSSIHVDDGGRAVAALLDVPAGTYNVVDDEPLTKRAYADALAAAAGRRAWLRGPGRAAGLLGHRTNSLGRSLRTSNAKLRHVTGWVPKYPSAREGWAAMAANP